MVRVGLSGIRWIAYTRRFAACRQVVKTIEEREAAGGFFRGRSVCDKCVRTMTESKLKILAFGAHPDDCDIKAAGVAALYRDLGHSVKFVSVTNGQSGHQRISGDELVQIRRAEAAAAAAVLDVEYDVLDFPDGALEATLEARGEIISIIRRYRPDLVLTHRPNDYHPDHRNTSQLVCDAAYMVTVPPVVPDVPALRDNPVIAYFSDNFQRPYPFTPDVVVDVGPVLERIVDMLDCHRSQFYDWLAYNHRFEDQLPPDDAGRRAWLGEWFRERIGPLADQFREELIATYGPADGAAVQWVEAFEACEYGRRHRVVCPMCETKGYTARKAAGMEVRCPNPDCLIPVFTAPPIDEPKDEDEDAETDVAVPWWKSPANIAAVGAMVAVVGIGLWYFMFREKPGKKSAPNPADLVPGTRIDVVKTDKTGAAKTGKQPPDVKVAVKKVPMSKLRENAIRLMETTVGSGEISDTLRPASFQLIADTYAQIAKKKSSHEYINRLSNVASNVPFYEVRPLVELAWQEMKRDPQGGMPNAARYLDRAAAAAESLVRQTSRIRQDTVSLLAAGYYAVGKKEAARKLIESHAHTGDTGRTSLALVTAWHSDDFDYHAALIHSPYVDSEASQHVAVARILIHRGKADAALDWAQTQSDAVAKRECLLTWIEARGAMLFRNPLVRKPEDEVDPQKAAWEHVASVISELDPAGQVAAHARISLHAKSGKVAAEWLEKARAAAGKLPAPQTIGQPSVKQVFELKAVSVERKNAYRLAAVALGALARAENRRDGKSGWKSLERSLACARSLGPSPIGIRERLEMASSSNLRELRATIAREFNLDQANRVTQKVAEYRQRCLELQSEADAGFRQRVAVAFACRMFEQRGKMNPHRIRFSLILPFMLIALSTMSLTAIAQGTKAKPKPKKSDSAIRTVIVANLTFDEANQKVRDMQVADRQKDKFYVRSVDVSVTPMGVRYKVTFQTYLPRTSHAFAASRAALDEAYQAARAHGGILFTDLKAYKYNGRVWFLPWTFALLSLALVVPANAQPKKGQAKPAPAAKGVRLAGIPAMRITKELTTPAAADREETRLKRARINNILQKGQFTTAAERKLVADWAKWIIFSMTLKRARVPNPEAEQKTRTLHELYEEVMRKVRGSGRLFAKAQPAAALQARTFLCKTIADRAEELLDNNFQVRIYGIRILTQMNVVEYNGIKQIPPVAYIGSAQTLIDKVIKARQHDSIKVVGLNGIRRLALLGNPNQGLRRTMATAIIPILFDGSHNFWVHARAARTLGAIGEKTNLNGQAFVVQALAKTMVDKTRKPPVRCSAARALGRADIAPGVDVPFLAFQIARLAKEMAEVYNADCAAQKAGKIVEVPAYWPKCFRDIVFAFRPESATEMRLYGNRKPGLLTRYERNLRVKAAYTNIIPILRHGIRQGRRPERTQQNPNPAPSFKPFANAEIGNVEKWLAANKPSVNSVQPNVLPPLLGGMKSAATSPAIPAKTDGTVNTSR
eukprot:g21989.t1